MKVGKIIMERYNTLNGLRTFACLGILAMHVYANINYAFNGNILNNFIKELTNFVFLFMILSSFVMCCGYYEKIKNNNINRSFYKFNFNV